MLHRLSFVTFVALTLAASSPVAAAPTVVAQSGDPTISHNAAAGTLALSAGGTTLTLNLDASHDFAVDKLVTASNGAWAVGVLPDTFLTNRQADAALWLASGGVQVRQRNGENVRSAAAARCRLQSGRGQPARDTSLRRGAWLPDLRDVDQLRRVAEWAPGI
jgi:hypothetical protein